MKYTNKITYTYNNLEVNNLYINDELLNPINIYPDENTGVRPNNEKIIQIALPTLIAPSTNY